MQWRLSLLPLLLDRKSDDNIRNGIPFVSNKEKYMFSMCITEKKKSEKSVKKGKSCI